MTKKNHTLHANIAEYLDIQLSVLVLFSNINSRYFCMKSLISHDNMLSG